MFLRNDHFLLNVVVCVSVTRSGFLINQSTTSVVVVHIHHNDQKVLQKLRI